MRFGSVCSGIEAASVAFGPLGWKAAWVSEIEPFPSAVLAHHYPDTPNLGDMTAIEAAVRSGVVEAPDMLCGGTPCQAFSVAGLRRSLADARGNLSLAFVELANAIDDVRADRGEPAAVVLWENVPGVLATTDNAFGCFLAGLAGCDQPIDPGGDGWTNAGVVLGPRRVVCWRVLDAQYFGLAQRRRRVFVVASAREGFDPVAVLLESEGVRRDSPPRREAREGSSGDTGKCAGGNGRGWPAEIASTLSRAFGDKLGLEDQHALNGAPLFVPDVMGTITSRMFNALGPRDVEEGALLAVGPPVPTHVESARGEWKEDELASTCRVGGGPSTLAFAPVAFSCKDHGADAGEVAPDAYSIRTANTSSNGWGIQHEVTHTLDQAQGLAIAHTLKGEGFDASEDGTGRGTPLVPVAVGVDAHNQKLTGDIVPTMAGCDFGNRTPQALTGMAVRRLTPRECERLQGFHDDYTAIPWRGKPADECPDGPRYKALGNSWAVPCVAWIGRRIQASIEAAA